VHAVIEHPLPPPKQRMLFDLTRNYASILVSKHREAIRALARALAEGETGDKQAA
jgi:hypothetical protein